MIYENGRYLFGFWDEIYGTPTDKYEDFEQYRNTIDKERVIRHIESLEDALASARVTDRFTGEKFNAGFYMDGIFTISVDFLRYYKTQDIGIPYEYEEYLKEKFAWDDVAAEYIDTFRCLGIFYEEPAGTERLLNGKDGDVCHSLQGETPETFHDRIERSKKAGRNLFYEELPEYRIEYLPNVQY